MAATGRSGGAMELAGHLIAWILGITLLIKLVFLPLHRIFRYLACGNPAYAALRDFFGWFQFDESERAKSRQVTIEGLAGLISLLTLPGGLWLLFVGPRPEDRLFGLLLLAAFALWAFSIVAEARARTLEQEAAPKRATPRLIRPAATLAEFQPVAPDRPEAPPEREAAPRRAPALVLAALAVGGWALLVRPWNAGAANPFMAGVWSLAAVAFCFVAPGLWNSSREADGREPLRFQVLRDLRLAFSIMAAASFLFAFLNAELAARDAYAGARAVAQIRAVQQGLADSMKALKDWKVTLWIGVAVFVAGALLLKRGYVGWFDRLLEGRKRLGKAMKVGGIVSLCVGSFSLAGIPAACAADRALSTSFALGQPRIDAADKVMLAVERALAARAIEPLLAAEADPGCPPDAGRALLNREAVFCPHPLTDAIVEERAESVRLRALWPRRLAAAPIAEAERAAGAAEAQLDELQRLDGAARRAAPAPTLDGTLPWVGADAALGVLDPDGARALDAAVPEPDPLGAALAAVKEAPPAPSSSAEHTPRSRQLTELAVELLWGQLPLDVEAPGVEKGGAFVKTLAGKVTDAVKKPFEEAAQKAAADIIEGCRADPAGCRETTEARLAQAVKDPRVQAFAHEMAPRVRPVVAAVSQTYARARDANLRARATLGRAMEPILRGEAQGPWSALRRAWADRLGPQTRNFDRTPDGAAWRLLDGWRKTTYDEAKGAYDAGKPGPDDGWNAAFFRFVERNELRATLTQMMEGDPAARAYLAGRINILPDLLAEDDLYPAFAVDVWGTPERALAHTAGARAVLGRGAGLDVPVKPSNREDLVVRVEPRPLPVPRPRPRAFIP